MTTFLTPEMQEGLAAARRLAARGSTRLRVAADGQTWPILRLWDGGFALRSSTAPRLRGLVDIFDGGRHLMHALVVASDTDGDEQRFDFKRATRALDQAPVDFVRDTAAPAGFIAPR